MNKEKGFTFIELVIYIAAFVAVAVIFTLFLLNLIEIQAKIRINREVLDSGQKAMEMMLFEIKRAQDIYTPTSSFDSHPGQLSLKTGHQTPSGEKTTFLDFYLDGNDRLCLKREGAEAIPLTPEKVKIDNLVFSYLTATSTKTIRIQLSASYNNPGAGLDFPPTTTLISSAVLRSQ